MSGPGEQQGGEAVTGGGESLLALARRLVRRRFWNLVLAQASWVVALALSAFILLLVAGAAVLEGVWLAAVVTTALAWGAFRVARNRPAPYAVLQEVDRRLGLKDTLSSAYYFQRLAPGEQPSDGARRVLFAQAEKLAGELDAARAVPIKAPRRAWIVGCLLAMAGGLFGLRYGVTGRLDLRPPLAAAFLPRPSNDGQGEPRLLRDPISEGVRRMLRQVGLIADPATQSLQARSAAPLSDGGQSAELAAVPPRPDLSRPVPASASEEGAEGDGENGESTGLAAGPDGTQPGDGNNSKQPWAESNSDLLEKFREALASLLSQLKPRTNSGDGMPVETPGGATESARTGKASEKGGQGPGRQSQGQGNTEAEGAEESGEAERAQGASGKSGGRDADLQAAREGRSGIGKEDGRKDTREAEQLAAMGKLSELIGRRQANLTGEVTVEVASGSQKLRTPYSDREARHTEAGGVVHRDEVPLILRDYVQRYLELVRKTPAAEHGESAAGRQP